MVITMARDVLNDTHLNLEQDIILSKVLGTYKYKPISTFNKVLISVLNCVFDYLLVMGLIRNGVLSACILQLSLVSMSGLIVGLFILSYSIISIVDKI
jgi:hypothetical protein